MHVAPLGTGHEAHHVTFGRPTPPLQVLVRMQAQNLLDAFQVNVVF